MAPFDSIYLGMHQHISVELLPIAVPLGVIIVEFMDDYAIDS
jgi:hypothetical protein